MNSCELGESFVPTAKTAEAFAHVRSRFGNPQTPDPNVVANDDELIQMTSDDGLREWEDGPGRWDPLKLAPVIAIGKDIHLWVVRPEDVVYAAEACAFGQPLQTGVIKHTNLTGGQPAFAGGEVLFFEGQTIVINGKSARYPVRSAAELDTIAKAFQQSGYTVWSMGFDDEAGRPYPFTGVEPKLVA